MAIPILVATDFSNDAYNALFHAVQLYQDQECSFHIIHVFNERSHFRKEYPGRKSGKTLSRFIYERTTEHLEEIRLRIRLDTGTNTLHTFLTVCREGDLVKEVSHYVFQYHIALLVMGNKGRTGAKEIFLGGNTIRVVKSHTACPVLCVPKEIDYRPPSRIAYITSLERHQEKDTLEAVKYLAETHKASLHILHVRDPDPDTADQERNRERLLEYFRPLNVCFYAKAKVRSKAKTVVKFVLEHAIDLLAMVYYPHNPVDRIFREPVVLDLGFYIEIPMLIIPRRD